MLSHSLTVGNLGPIPGIPRNDDPDQGSGTVAFFFLHFTFSEPTLVQTRQCLSNFRIKIYAYVKNPKSRGWLWIC